MYKGLKFRDQLLCATFIIGSGKSKHSNFPKVYKDLLVVGNENPFGLSDQR